MPDFKLNKRTQELQIKVQDKEQIPARSAAKNDAIHRGRSEGYFPRRQQKQDVLINFWDLGQKWNGSAWKDLDFVISPTLQMQADPGTDVIAETFTPANYTTLKDQILSVPFSDFPTTYRKLDYEIAEQYGLDLYLGGHSVFEADKYYPVARNGSRPWIRDSVTPIINTRWTPEGLKIPRGTANFAYYSNLAFIWEPFGSGVGTQSPVRITQGDQFTSPAINFAFDADADIFLMPQPVLEFATTPLVVGLNARYLLNGLYTIMSREFYLERDIDNLNVPGLHTAFEVGAFDFNFFAQKPEIDPQLINFMTSRSESRLFEWLNGAFVNPADFLNLAQFGFFAGHDSQRFTLRIKIGVPIFAQVLVALIKKGSTWFYVWNNTFTRDGTESVWHFRRP